MLSLNGWTLFFTVLNILVLFWGLKKFLFRPVMNVIDQREELIKRQLTEAENTKKEAHQLKESYEQVQKTAREQAENIILSAKEQAQKEQERTIGETQKEREQMLAKARRDIVNEQARAKREAQLEITALAMEAARKIMKTGDTHDTAGR